MDTPLSSRERSELTRLERIVEAGKDTVAAVGRALLEIHKQKLYREGGQTWERYCLLRWGFVRQQAERLIAYASTLANLGYDAENDTAPTGATGAPAPREGTVRPLAKVPAEQRRDVWEQAAAEAFPSRPTAAGVSEVAQRALAGLPVQQQLEVLGRREDQLEEETAALEKLPEQERRRLRILKHLRKARNPAASHGGLDDVVQALDGLIARVEAVDG